MVFALLFGFFFFVHFLIEELEMKQMICLDLV